jgi:hypothetical protein
MIHLQEWGLRNDPGTQVANRVPRPEGGFGQMSIEPELIFRSRTQLQGGRLPARSLLPAIAVANRSLHEEGCEDGGFRSKFLPRNEKGPPLHGLKATAQQMEM